MKRLSPALVRRGKIVVFGLLAADTLACAIGFARGMLDESNRLSLATLPDTTWQDGWRAWLVGTIIAWVAAIILVLIATDATKKT